MDSIEGKKLVVVGGSRGLGLAVVEAAVAKKAIVTVIARTTADLEALRGRLGVNVIAGDATDRALAERVVRELQPDVLILTAGAVMPLAPIHEQTWESFETIWNVDVKSSLFWTQAALNLPLKPGSRVMLSSSGAAITGTPLSGGYSAAKRMVWMMAQYANTASKKLERGIHFQALISRQIIPSTGVGTNAIRGHARELGISEQAFLTRFDNPLSAQQYGQQVVAALTNPQWDKVTALGFKGGDGTTSLDA